MANVSYRSSGSVTTRALLGALFTVIGGWGQWSLFQSTKNVGEPLPQFDMVTMAFTDLSLAAFVIGIGMIIMAFTDDQRREDRNIRDSARSSTPGFEEEYEET